MKWLSVVALCAACGGSGSGVDGSKQIVDLDDSETRALCEYRLELDGTEREIDCGNGLVITLAGGSVDLCITGSVNFREMFPNCKVTVDELEACLEEWADASDATRCHAKFTDMPACKVFSPAECGSQ